MEHRDISAVHKLLTEYLKQFHLMPVMSREEVEHWFLPQENIIDTFVVEVREQERDRGVFCVFLGFCLRWRSVQRAVGAVEEVAAPGGEMLLQGGRFELLEDGASPSWAAPSPLAESPHITQTGRAPQRLWLGFILALMCCGVTSGFQSAPGEVTDFLSFYTLPSTIMNHPTHKSLKAAYSFYNVHTKTPLIDLMSDALILAKSVSDGGARVAPWGTGQLTACLAALGFMGRVSHGAGLVPRAVQTQILKDLLPRRGTQG